MRVLYLSGIPAPYRVDLFNEMGKTVQLTVAFLAEYQSERNKAWQSSKAENYRTVFLNKGALNGKRIDLSMVRYLRAHASEFDVIVVHGYSFTASVLAIAWLRLHGVRFGIEADGAILPRGENALKTLLKRFCIRKAAFWLSSGKATTDFFVHYGAKRENCFVHPFTSISRRDIVQADRFTKDEKKRLREKLGIREEKVVITVGRFSCDGGYGKGYDLLMKVAERLHGDVGVYFLGDEPTKEFTDWKAARGLSKVHFIGYMQKAELSEYYACADLFVLLTRGDVWGLAVNEAMMFGLPVITTSQCLAGLELVQDGVNGAIVSVENEDAIFDSVSGLIRDEEKLRSYGEKSVEMIAAYTSEASSPAHLQALSEALRAVRQIHRDCARARLQIGEDRKLILYVGQMIYRKGIDVLLSAMRLIPGDCDLYLIGGKTNNEYAQMAASYGLSHVRFFDFMGKEQLKLYYQAADLFVLPTREDIWGLVVNEALNYGLPVVSTYGCVAACEMLPKGSLVQVADEKELAGAVSDAFSTEDRSWQLYAFRKTWEYTIENSSRVHIETFSGALHS